jgi:hypothetical protein
MINLDAQGHTGGTGLGRRSPVIAVAPYVGESQSE